MNRIARVAIAAATTVATLGAATAADAQSQSTQCLKTGQEFDITGVGFDGSSTVDVRFVPERVLVISSQVQVTTGEDLTFDDALPLGSFAVGSGGFAGRVKVPKPATFRGLPIIRGDVNGRGNASPSVGPVTPPLVQVDQPSATVVTYNDAGDGTSTVKPTIGRSDGYTVEPYAFGNNKKVYQHFVDKKGKIAKSGLIGTSKSSPAYPCGSVGSKRAITNFSTIKKGSYTLVVNTNKKKATGGVRMKAKVR